MTTHTLDHTVGNRFLELYTPKLVTVLRERYTLANFKADVLAGLTVAIVALPLSMAIAIASGASPAQDFIPQSLEGFSFPLSVAPGSRSEACGRIHRACRRNSGTTRFGRFDTRDNAFRCHADGGRFASVRNVYQVHPLPVTVGFTAGIAIIIFASQLKELFGLAIEHEPGELLKKFQPYGRYGIRLRRPPLWSRLVRWRLSSV